MRNLLLLVVGALGGCADGAWRDGWTLVVLPDTQVYTASFPDIFAAQTQWIADNAESLAMRYVLHVGDVTESNTASEWQVARNAFAALDGIVPYAIVPGNHDYYGDKPRTSGLSEYFAESDFQIAPTYGGQFEIGRMDNTYHLFTADHERWLILALEWGPRDRVLTWANEVVNQYPDHRVIVLTHAYLYYDDTRYDWAGKGRQQLWNPHDYPVSQWPEVNDGEEMWTKLVSRHANIELVVCGHVLADGVGRLTSPGAKGASVHQLLANFQTGPRGGDGYLRLLRIGRDRIDVQTYSPFVKRLLAGPDHDFSLPRALAL